MKHSIDAAAREARATAEAKAWDSLARYKFEMFGYWASKWVSMNALFAREDRLPNPFRSLVQAARAHKRSQVTAAHAAEE
jgi:hypothetical protein